MWLYWSMFSVPALASLAPTRLAPTSRKLVSALVLSILVLIIGLRDRVGADWEGYGYLFDISQVPIQDIFKRKEWGFTLVNWVSGQLNFGVYGVNTFCALVFISGLIAYFQRQPSFYRALALSVPTLVLGVAMSAERQSTAIGFLMFAMNAFEDRKPVRYLMFIALAALFHQTAAIFAIYVFAIGGKLRPAPFVLGAAFFVIVGTFLLRDTDYYTTTYVAQDQGGAAGALPRVAFTVLAALTYFALRKRWTELYGPSTLYTLMAATAVIMAPGVIVAQVATDRIVQYLLPFQIVVFSRLPEFVQGRLRTPVTALIFAAYAATMAVWLNYSWIAKLTWLPYRSILFSAPYVG